VAADYSADRAPHPRPCLGEESLLAAFRAGEDIHRRHGRRVFGVELAAVTSEQRDVAKTTNFSIILRSDGLRAVPGSLISPKQAQEFLDRFFERASKVKAYLERTVAEGRERGFVQTLLGRRRYIPELRSGNPNLRGFAERMATNAPVQGTAADLIKIAMVRMAKALTESGLESRMLLQIRVEDAGASGEHPAHRALPVRCCP